MMLIKKSFFYDVEKFPHCTEVRFASFLSSGFTTMVVINPPEKKLAKRTSVHWSRGCHMLILLRNWDYLHMSFTQQRYVKKNKGRHGTFASISPNYFSYLQVVNAVWD